MSARARRRRQHERERRPSQYNYASDAAATSELEAPGVPRSRYTAPPPFVPVPSHMRDALTGAPLVRGALRMRLEPEPHAEGRVSEEALAFPRRIDTSEPYHVDGGSHGHPEDYEGGLQWSSDFARYIAPALPRDIQEARRVWREWWDVPIVLERLATHMSAEKLQAALAVTRDGEDYHAVATRYRHTLTWVARAKAQAVRLVRTKYLPHAAFRDAYRLAESFRPLPPDTEPTRRTKRPA